MEKKQVKLQQKSDCFISKQLSIIKKNIFPTNMYLWIDKSIHNSQNKQILLQLKNIDINPILCLTLQQVHQTLKKYSNYKFKIISSATMGEPICKQFNKHKQIVNIYIFCGHKPAGQALKQKWGKIKFYAIDAKQFLIKLKEQSSCDNRFSQLPSFMKITTKDDTHDNTLINKSRYNLHGLFLFKNRIQAKNDFLKLARQFYLNSNKSELQEFQKEYPTKYNHKLALNWYTRETFFYKLLNNFLRSSSNPLQTVYLRLPFDATFKAIKYFYDQGKEKKNMTVYRGGFINDNQLKYLEKNVGQYIEMFGFMSTSIQIDIAKQFIKNYKGNSLITVIIEDQQRQKKIDYGYTNLTEYSKFNEAQVLFNALNVFKVVCYKKQDEIYHITLKYGQLARIVFLGEDKLQYKQKNILINYKHQQKIIQKFISQGDVFKFCQMYDNQLQYRQKYIIDNKANENLDLADQLDKMGAVYDEKNEYNKAFEYFQRSLKIKMDILGENLSTANTLQNIGLLYDNKGQYNKALQYYQKSLKINMNILGENHSNTAATLSNIGIIYYSKYEHDKALQYYQKSLKTTINILGENHDNTASTLQNIGLVYDEKGQYDKALQYYERSLKIKMNILGENHSSTAGTISNIGSVYERKADYIKALQYFQRSLKIHINIFGEEHSSTAIVLSNIGQLYSNQKKYKIAQSYFNRCYKIRTKIYGPDHKFTTIVKQHIKRCQKK